MPLRLVCGRGSSTYLELGKGQRRRRILCLFLVFGACPSRGDDCKPHRSGPSDGRGGFLSSIRFKDPLVPQGALEKELGGFYSKRGPIRAESGAKLLAAVPPRGERSGSRCPWTSRLPSPTGGLGGAGASAGGRVSKLAQPCWRERARLLLTHASAIHPI